MFWGSQSCSSPSWHNSPSCLVPILEREGDRKQWKRQFWELQPQNLQAEAAFAKVPVIHPLPFLFPWDAQDACRDRMISNSGMEALKPFLTQSLCVHLFQLSAPCQGGFPNTLNSASVLQGRGEKTGPFCEEKALCGFPRAFERAPGAEGTYVLL